MTRKSKLSDIEWMDKHLQLRKTIVDDLMTVSEIAYNVKAWTPLKLISIGYFTSIYITIISKYFDRWIYCDLFAGCGVNLIKGGDYFPGSPFMVLEAAKNNPFHRIYLVESNSKFANALIKRIEWCSQNLDDYSTLGQDDNPRCLYDVYSGSFEDFFRKSDFVHEFNKEKTHALTVIDPEGFEIGWKQISELFSFPIDIIYIFMTGLIRREWGKAQKNDEKATKNMSYLFGDDSWKTARSGEELASIYQRNLESHGRSVVSIKIQDSRSKFFYHLFVITRKTKGGNPWLKGVKTLKERIERSQSGMVQASLDYLQKRAKRVTDFF